MTFIQLCINVASTLISYTSCSWGLRRTEEIDRTILSVWFLCCLFIVRRCGPRFLLKAPYFSTIDIFFFIQERFNKLIYSINTITWWQPVEFHLVSRVWTESKNEMIFFFFFFFFFFFYHIIFSCWQHQLGDTIQKSFHFKNERLTGLLQAVRCHMVVLIPYINLLNLSWIINCLFLRNMESLNSVLSLVVCAVHFAVCFSIILRLMTYITMHSWDFSCFPSLHPSYIHIYRIFIDPTGWIPIEPIKILYVFKSNPVGPITVQYRLK